MKKRTLKSRIEALGLNYNKEIALMAVIFISFAIGGFAIYFFLKETMIGIVVMVLGLVVDAYYITRYSSLEKNLEKEHIEELVSLLSYFEIYISNKNNVYNSFKLLLPYCSVFMDDAINGLLNHIDQDKTVGPYIEFATKFNSNVIESLMLSIYQMVDNGENINQFSEFDLHFSNIRNKHQDDLIDSKKKSLDSLNVYPLIGAGLITITLSLSIIAIIGDYVNVI